MSQLKAGGLVQSGAFTIKVKLSDLVLILSVDAAVRGFTSVLFSFFGAEADLMLQELLIFLKYFHTKTV